MKCLSCGAFWFYRRQEFVDFGGDRPETMTFWYTKLEDSEVETIMLSPQKADISFLAHRPCLRIDERGLMRVDGQPTSPIY